MRYQININQYVLKQLESRIRLEEAVLLDYIYWLCSSPSEDVKKKRVTYNEEEYTWFNYGYYLQENFLLKGKTKGTITPKLKLLEEEGFIATFIDKQTSRKYIRMLPKVDELFRKLNTPVKITKRTRLRRQTPPFSNLNIDNSNIDNSTNDNNKVNEFINLFKEINPSYERLFQNKTQRAATERLIGKFSTVKLKKMLNTVVVTNRMKYAPVIMSPLDLENKLDALIAFIEKEKSNKKNNKILT